MVVGEWAEDVVPEPRVGLHHASLGRRQGGGLEQDRVRDSDLADVVHLRRQLEEIHLSRAESELARDRVRVDGDALRVVERVRIAAVDLVGHPLHRAHGVAPHLDPLPQRVVDESGGHDRKQRQPGEPRGGEGCDRAEQVEARELDVDEPLGVEEQRERAARGGEGDRKRDEEDVDPIHHDGRGDQGERALGAGQPRAGGDAGGLEQQPAYKGRQVRLAAVEEEVDRDRTQRRPLTRAPDLAHCGDGDVQRLQRADQRSRLRHREQQHGGEEDRAGDADLHAEADVKGELERQQARRGQRRHQPPVQAAGLKPAERGDEDRERDRADAQPVQLGAPARCHFA